MLPMHHRSSEKWEKWEKWGVNNMSKVLVLALFLLLLSLQILTWNGRSLVQIPCPFPDVDHSSLPSPASLEEAFPDIDRPVLPTNCTQVEGQLKPTTDASPPLSPPTLPPNSYFPDSDSDAWPCRQHRVDERNMTYHDWVSGNFTDEQVLCAAHRYAKQPMATGTPRIAFLFLTRGSIPFEPLWRRFFAGHEGKYSLYVHSTDATHTYGPDSLFHNRTIPSKAINKVTISLPEAIRRLFAYALLDSSTPNVWFHLLCDSSIPIRSFPFTYSYITNSNYSFVEAFHPTSKWWTANWNTTGEMAIPDHLMRKGEAWITVHRRHAGMIVGDHYIFPKFKHHWYQWGIHSEVYVPTLLTVADPTGVANRSLMYVNWLDSERSTSSPVEFNHTQISPGLFREMQNLTSNEHGFYQFDKAWNDETERSCVYNGVADSPCFLFARKFSRAGENVAALMRVSPVLGYA